MSTATSPLLTVDPRGCIFSIVGTDESVPQKLFASLRAAKEQELLIIGGGVKFFAPEDVARMVPWVLNGFRGFGGVALSGGTAYFDKATGKLKSEIITALPSELAAIYECIAIGTFPRVEDFAFDREHHFLYTDTYGAVVDDRYHHIASIQKNASDVMGWDGDLLKRFEMIDALSKWLKAYLLINGGDVTRVEGYMALERDMHVIAGYGSKRETDALVAAKSGDWSLTAKEMRDNAQAKVDKAKAEGKDEETVGKLEAKVITANAEADAAVAYCQSVLAGREELVHVVGYGDDTALYDTAKRIGFKLAA